MIVLGATFFITAIVGMMDLGVNGSLKFIYSLFKFKLWRRNNNRKPVQDGPPEKESKWYVLRVVSGKERKVKEYLDKDIVRNGWDKIDQADLSYRLKKYTKC